MSSAEISSSASSTPPPPPPLAAKKKKSVKKDKGKNKPQVEDQGKNEGVDLNWAYTPPPGAVLLEEEDVDAGEFDWDRINDDEDLELCLIRIPDSVKPTYLENVPVHMRIASTPSQSSCVGTLKRKHVTFDIWSVGNDSEQPVGGEELKSLSCLLPRKKKKGKLYPAPKPFTHHLLISAQSAVPTPYASSSSGTGDAQLSSMIGPPYKNPPRQSYAKEVLKHRFMPYGSLVNVTNSGDEVGAEDQEIGMVIDVDTGTTEAQSTVPPKTRRKRGKTVDETRLETPLEPSTTTEAEPEGKKAKGKKRKGESTDTAETPKKSKKTKT